MGGADSLMADGWLLIYCTVVIGVIASWINMLLVEMFVG